MNKSPLTLGILVAFLLVLFSMCALATGLFTFGVSRSPRSYAQATMMIEATAVALPFQVTALAEENRHQVEMAAINEAAYTETMATLTTVVQIGLGALGILLVMGTVAGSFRAGATAMQAAKTSALPGWIDLGEGYRLLDDGGQPRLLDTRTGVTHLLSQDGRYLPARAHLTQTELLAHALQEVSSSRQGTQATEWLGSAMQTLTAKMEEPHDHLT